MSLENFVKLQSWKIRFRKNIYKKIWNIRWSNYVLCTGEYWWLLLQERQLWLASAVWWWIGKLPLVPSSVLMRVDNCFFAARLLLRSWYFLHVMDPNEVAAAATLAADQHHHDEFWPANHLKPSHYRLSSRALMQDG